MRLTLAAILAASAAAGSALAQPPGPPPGPPPGYGPPPSPGSFWYGAPVALRDRIRFLDHRLLRLRNDQHISPGEFQVDHNGVVAIERQDEQIAERSGGRPSPQDEAYLWRRLNALSARVHWDQRYGY